MEDVTDYPRPVQGGAPGGMAGSLPGHDVVRAWRGELTEDCAKQKSLKRKRSVEALKELIESDGIVHMYVQEMIREVQERCQTIGDYHQMLDCLNHILEKAPEWEEDENRRIFFPVSALFKDMMMTVHGEAAFRDVAFNAAICEVLKEWCAFLNSKKSCYVLNKEEHGWLSPAASRYTKLDDFVIPDKNAPHYGWKSYNDFFHREIKPSKRCVDGPDDPKVIVSANDGAVYKIASDVKALDEFWIKGGQYSLSNMLNGSKYLEKFVHGHVIQSYLSGGDYHRWHSPVDGTVVDATVVEALMFSNPEWARHDIKGIKSQSYYTAINTRGLTFIESDDPAIGMVCCMAVGITEISSITLTAKPRKKVKKGDQLGYFSYGGSSLALIFEKDAIKHFTIDAPKDPEKETITIKVNAQIAVAK